MMNVIDLGERGVLGIVSTIFGITDNAVLHAVAATGGLARQLVWR